MQMGNHRQYPVADGDLLHQMLFLCWVAQAPESSLTAFWMPPLRCHSAILSPERTGNGKPRKRMRFQAENRFRRETPGERDTRVRPRRKVWLVRRQPVLANRSRHPQSRDRSSHIRGLFAAVVAYRESSFRSYQRTCSSWLCRLPKSSGDRYASF
jgi:hypothetical protein